MSTMKIFSLPTIRLVALMGMWFVTTTTTTTTNLGVCAFTYYYKRRLPLVRIQHNDIHLQQQQQQQQQQQHESRFRWLSLSSSSLSSPLSMGNNKDDWDSNDNNNNNNNNNNKKTNTNDDETELEFLQREIEHLNSLEALLAELELEDDDDDEEDDDDDDELGIPPSSLLFHNDSFNPTNMGIGGEEEFEDDDETDEFLDFFGSLPEDVDPEELAQLEQEMMYLSSISRHEEEEEDVVVVEETTNKDDITETKDTAAKDSLLSNREKFHTSEEDDILMNGGLLEDTTMAKHEEEQDHVEASSSMPSSVDIKASSLFEDALLQGVVPADAGVGKSNLPGDFGFDPWDMARKDYIRDIQSFFWNLIPGDPEDMEYQAKAAQWKEPRPPALILRDYREAEIRHGRLAMMAAMIWPLQEMLDRLLLEEYQYSSTTIVYGGVTLPYFSLLMTLVMMLLGYLDIYANVIKDMDDVGEAFLPGDCFWDPLRILEGAPPPMKRNMQERELFNGRFAMMAIAFFVFEEATTHTPVISIPGNELLFEPAYQISYIQSWLDSIFASPSPVFVMPDDVGSVDFADTVNQVLQEEETVRTIILKEGGEVLYTDIPY